MRVGSAAILAYAVCLALEGCAAPHTVSKIVVPAPQPGSGIYVVRDDALPAPVPDLADGGAVVQTPNGFANFCLRFPDQCVVPAGAPARIALTAHNWQILETVNLGVNRAIMPMDDVKHYGRPEYWTIASDGYGDCEDYALTKRRDLMAAGLPLSALRLAVVTTWNGERHAVLTVATTQGDYVLDNLRPDIVGPDQAGYQWVERQDPALPQRWVALGGGQDRMFVAALDAPVGAPR